MSDKLVKYYENIGRDKTAKRITEDPDYAKKMQKLWDKREARKQKRLAIEEMKPEDAGYSGGGRALRGYGKAYMKGGRVK